MKNPALDAAPEKPADKFPPALPNYQSGTYNMVEMGFPCVTTTLDSKLGEMIFSLRKTILADRRLLFADGRVMTACINWIRDHVHEMKAFAHWEHDLVSYFQFFLDHQSPEGWYFEMVKQLDDPHWRFVSPKFAKKFPEDNVAATRLELEADVEYLMVEGALQIYRVTGDDEWMRETLPKLEKGMEYLTSDPLRWDAEHGLVKRPFTIDTWDFAYGRPNDDRRVTPDSPMSIMHGDNSGAYQAMQSLAWLRERFGDAEKALAWRTRAETLRENMMKHLWNGRYFLHQLHLNHDGADALEAERLSLSNAYDMNRGVTTPEQSRSILAEYRRRLETTEAFAEWFSVDPPYERFGVWEKGKYVNGGIASYAGGELAKAAFRNGMEEYGVDILRRMNALILRDGGLYFLYDPRTGANLGGGPSGWGAAATLSAIEEGLAGIVDLDVQYRVMAFEPRWAATEYDALRYITGYELTKTLVEAYCAQTPNALRYRLRAPSREIRCHILLPKGRRCEGARVNGEEVAFRESLVGESRYVDFTLRADEPSRDRYGWTEARAWEIECRLA